MPSPLNIALLLFSVCHFVVRGAPCCHENAYLVVIRFPLPLLFICLTRKRIFVFAPLFVPSRGFSKPGAHLSKPGTHEALAPKNAATKTTSGAFWSKCCRNKAVGKIHPVPKTAKGATSENLFLFEKCCTIKARGQIHQNSPPHHPGCSGTLH